MLPSVRYNRGMSKISTPQSEQLPFIVTNTPQVISLVAAIILISTSLVWWTKVHNNPRRVFEGMLNNNLSTASVTRTTTASDGSGLDKQEQVSFVPPYGMHSIVTVTQEGSDISSSRVVTETIGTLAEDYSRYLSINTTQKGKSGKQLDFRSIQGTWGKTGIENGNPKYFSQSILGLIPFANLDTKTRQDTLNQLNSNKTYVVDYSKVKPSKYKGKSALVFPVKVDAKGYVGVLKKLSKNLGVADTNGLDPESYAGQPPIEISITVDKASRHVLEVTYGQQKEVYSSHGLSLPVQTPTKSIPVDQLQQKVREIQ